MTTNKSRRCIKCTASFKPAAPMPWAKKCPKCRATPQPAGAHTHAWDKRSLGIVEAAILRNAWGAKRSNNATGD